MTDNNTLPEELQKQIESESWNWARYNYAKAHKQTEESAEYIQSVAAYSRIVGATEYASKLHLLQQQVEDLQRWKEEAKLVMNPILEYGQSHPDIKLGDSITTFVIDRCKEYDKLKGENERLTIESDEWKLCYDVEKTEHAALKVKAEVYEIALKKIKARYPTPYFAGITAQEALSSYNSTNNQKENDE